MNNPIPVYKKIGWVVVLLCLPWAGYAQPDSVQTIHRKRQHWVIGSSATAYTGSMVFLSSAWYSQYKRQSFRFFNDAAEWKQMDKVGHTFSAFHIAAIGSATWQWAGKTKPQADRIATLTSFAIMSSIEILDGFSAGYGASATDLAANALGAGLYLGQQKIWNETRLYPKFSFQRTAFAPQRPGTLGHGLAEEILKDYNGQTYWLSVDADKFFRFPKWLNFSLGYGAEGMLYASDQANLQAGLKPYRKYFVGLEVDLTAFKSRSKFLNSVLFALNTIRIPGPALQFSKGTVKRHLFYF
ncbi:MAG: DUF2279 domain-containing protein [Cytophagales bacterium]|nr:DUF2279 domain-containing protein [Cytophagales bacterium]